MPKKLPPPPGVDVAWLADPDSGKGSDKAVAAAILPIEFDQAVQFAEDAHARDMNAKQVGDIGAKPPEKPEPLIISLGEKQYTVGTRRPSLWMKMKTTCFNPS
jgi:hypothetical protein